MEVKKKRGITVKKAEESKPGSGFDMNSSRQGHREVEFLFSSGCIYDVHIENVNNHFGKLKTVMLVGSRDGA